MTNLSIEERLQIIREIYLVVGHNLKITKANGPRIDFFHLTGAILENNVYECHTTQRLIGALKKSPVWKKILPFIHNQDDSCGHKGCRCREQLHSGKNKACTGSHYKLNRTTYKYTRVQCECPHYIRKEFT